MNVRYSIVYASISICMASIVFSIYRFSNKAAFLLAALFFIICFAFLSYDYLDIDYDKNFFNINSIRKALNKNTIINFICFVLIFFCIGIVNNLIYYSKSIPDTFSGDVRIEKIFSNSYIVTSNKRNFYLSGKINSCMIGERYYIEGKYTNQIDSEYGNLGNIISTKSIKLPDDNYTKLIKFRNNIYNKFKDKLGKRKAAIICSLSFGYSDVLDSQDQDEFRNLGVIHAISVSGLHVAIIYNIVSILFNKKLSIIITFIYVLFTGVAYSCVRAFIMIFLKAFAVDFRRKYNPITALAFSSIIIVIFKPYSVFNIGFQLSFLASLGIILFNNTINHKLYKLPGKIRESLSISVSSMIFTIPVLICSFEKISYLSIVGNLLIVPLLVIIIKLGNISILFFCFPKVFNVICYIANDIIRILDYFFDCIYLINNSVYLNKNFVIVYVFFLVALLFFNKNYKKSICLILSACISWGIFMYSPIVNISYINNNSLLISYRGKRTIITNSINYESIEYKKRNMADKTIRKPKYIHIKEYTIEPKNKDFILYINSKEYLINMNSIKIENKEDNTIDFGNKKNVGFYLISDKIFIY